MLAFSLATLLATLIVQGRTLHLPHVKRQVITGSNGYEFDVLQHLAGNSPYFDSRGVQLNPAPPQGCRVSKAGYLVRHSNIYANDFDYDMYIEPFTSKLSNFTDRGSFVNVAKLEFLTNWTSPITNATEQLEKVTPSGVQAATAFGTVIANLYPQLASFNLTGINANNQSFRIWSASAERDVTSARAFINGAFPHNATRLVEVTEDENAGANSLAPHKSCPAFDGAVGTIQSTEFMDIYTAPIKQRLNQALPSFNFTTVDIVGMQQLCGYETVIRNSSEFCNAFDDVDWLGFEYAYDLKYFYAMGYGSPVAAQIGLPWIEATASLLESANTSQNLYVSFTHREEIPLALTALGLFNNSEYTNSDVNSTMPSTEINYGREWKTSVILPFLGHVALERLECDGPGNNATQMDTNTFVRTLVNGAPTPLPGCQDGPGATCVLDNFTRYIQSRVESYGDFIGACGIKNTNSTNKLTIYG